MMYLTMDYSHTYVSLKDFCFSIDERFFFYEAIKAVKVLDMFIFFSQLVNHVIVWR